MTGLERLLKVHEARWTTHGWERPYQVMHCAGGDCDWRLRQTARMSDDDCYDQHRAHVAAAVTAWLAERLASDEVREAVADAIGESVRHTNWLGDAAEPEPAADAALAAVVGALAGES